MYNVYTYIIIYSSNWSALYIDSKLYPSCVCGLCVLYAGKRIVHSSVDDGNICWNKDNPFWISPLKISAFDVNWYIYIYTSIPIENSFHHNIPTDEPSPLFIALYILYLYPHYAPLPVDYPRVSRCALWDMYRELHTTAAAKKKSLYIFFYFFVLHYLV